MNPLPLPRFCVGLVAAWAFGRTVGALLHSRNISH